MIRKQDVSLGVGWGGVSGWGGMDPSLSLSRSFLVADAVAAACLP